MRTGHNVPIYGKEDAHGLTKREWLAGMALQGLLANSYQSDILVQETHSMRTRHDIALIAVEQADAVIAYLNENQRS